ncbi:hypothetical protein SOI69_01270 [Acinetobacter pittii]|uniref:hypothetical protein n=1 Tax=Acinetobacter calcoaceticus/baumannii complex TaxID=909768 RepID=UPI00190242D8|nr:MULTISPECIES: hypothetical protein [Acinetobacter calcoaceticus/baumannii complex]MBJ9481340.1 hypothetical protein [Acinetobacter baumannii]MBJ9910216.1 hypothetical protein [Acinetobacter baumannii]MBJ9944703.1 hypothetical protein [Acinetobacter baumannii]MCO9026358.1 hypothetical protein [Acinetobacter baumannii]WPP55922.1 hypothetical protein SOI69_01270 [Acinetobacter pittii]
MKTLMGNINPNSAHVNCKLLEELEKLNTINKLDSNIKPSGFAINHPFDSNIYRDAIKDSERQTKNAEEVIAYSAYRW